MEKESKHFDSFFHTFMTMKSYFLLQYRMLNREISEFGVAPVIAHILFPVLFVLASFALFSKLEVANYIYIAIALLYLLKLNSKEKNDFLKTLFKQRDYLIIRAIENLLLTLPFLLFLYYKELYFNAIILLTVSIAIIFFNRRNTPSFTIPTPFSQQPFEFSIGFRENLFIFLFLLFLCVQSVIANNFNLGIFSLLSTTLVCLSFYNKLENPYFVWLFNCLSPKQFLFFKIKIGLKYFTLLSFPFLLVLCIFFHKEMLIITLFYLLSFCYLITIILAKYANYPHKISLIESIIIGVSYVFFPLLLIFIPYLYTKARTQLKTALE